jgi:ketosteroid isomerase-like protein
MIVERSADMKNNQAGVATQFFDALAADDIERLIQVMHPEIVWEVPGSSPVAGRFVGLEAVGAMMLGISEMAGGKVQVQMRELFVNESGVVALVEVDIAPEGEDPWRGEDAWLVRSNGAQITGVREHWFDTSGFDELASWKKEQN